MLRAEPAAVERRAQIFALFSGRTRRAYELARRENPQTPKLPAEAFLFHTGGLHELIRDCLRTRGPEALPDLAVPGVKATMALFGFAEK